MGQYFKFMNLDKKEKCQKNWHSIKLMEHSYVGNYYCNDTLRLLSKEWAGDRIIHAGDYAMGDDETNTEKIIDSLSKEFNIEDNTFYNYCESFKEVEHKEKDKIRYVYNLDKKEYVDLYKQPFQWVNCYNGDVYFTKVNSFALLIACGNDNNGGDYRGVNKELVGSWAGDHFISSIEKINEYDDFKENDNIFIENQKYEDFKVFNEEKLLKVDKEVWDDCINQYSKYIEKDTKLHFDSESLLDIEKNIFKEEFEKLKETIKNRDDGFVM